MELEEVIDSICFHAEDSQDPELMIDWLPTEVLLQAMKSPRVAGLEGIIRRALMVKAYDYARVGTKDLEARSDFAASLKWLRESYPDGLSVNDADGYIVKGLNPVLFSY